MSKKRINSIKTNLVYSGNTHNTVYLKVNNEKWFPINFQWIPVINLNNELNKK